MGDKLFSIICVSYSIDEQVHYKISSQIGAINTNSIVDTVIREEKKKDSRSYSKYSERAHSDRLYRLHSSYGQLSKTRRKFRVSSSREANALHYRRKTMTSKILRNYLHGRYVGKETQE